MRIPIAPALLSLLLVSALGCEEAKQQTRALTDEAANLVKNAREATLGPAPPAPKEVPTAEEMVTEFVDPPFAVKKSLKGLHLVWFDRNGVHTATKRDDIPEASRGRVQIAPLDTPADELRSSAKVYVADARTPIGNTYPVQRVTRHLFEIWVSEMTGDAVRTVPKSTAGNDEGSTAGSGKVGPVVLYRSTRCDDCEDAVAYFKKRGVAFSVKDITADPTAAAEMQKKLGTARLGARDLLTIDVDGEVTQGFNEARLDRILDAKEGKKSNSGNDTGWNRGLFDVDKPSKPHFQ